jgi:tetratricopeptide (TPR) repeat protein
VSEGKIFPITVIVIVLVFVLVGGFGYWYYASQKLNHIAKDAPRQIPSNFKTPAPEFEAVYAQLGIQPLPSTVERQEQVEARLSQLNREPCYRDAVVNLARALLKNGYPRESATSLRSFVKRCGGVEEILPLAYDGLRRISDFSGALEVAKQLVDAAPASATFRYWRALAYAETGNAELALPDYMNSMELFSNPKNESGHFFYEWSRIYTALGRYCDAITPIEMYVSLDPIHRRTPQTTKVISEYAEKGNCDTRYAVGSARVAFARTADVRTLTVLLNGVAGNLIFDTGASFVAITSGFASRAKVAIEPGSQLTAKTVGGVAFAEVGYADSIRVGKAEALGVTVAVHRDNPFGNRVDGLLGMSFLSRFHVTLSPTGIELTAIPLR